MYKAKKIIGLSLFLAALVAGTADAVTFREINPGTPGQAAQDFDFAILQMGEDGQLQVTFKDNKTLEWGAGSHYWKSPGYPLRVEYLGSFLDGNLAEIPTAVFAGLEYSCVGLSEEAARERFGEDIEVYHTAFTPLQWTVPANREYNQCYTKVIVDKSREELVLGVHLLSPEAGEVVQAYGVALKMGMTFSDLRELIGIHPTIGEELTLLTEPKSSGKDAVKSGC